MSKGKRKWNFTAQIFAGGPPWRGVAWTGGSFLGPRYMSACSGILYPSLYCTQAIQPKKERPFSPRVVHSGGDVATNTAKSAQKVMKMVDFSPIHHAKYDFGIKKVVAVDIRSVRTVRSFHILLVVIFHYSCWRVFACTPKAPFLPFHTPQW
jgi:hypothetical protein